MRSGRSEKTHVGNDVKFNNRWMVGFLLAVGIFCTVTLALSMFLGASPKLIVGDGAQYYAWARSTVLDRDVDFRNDYRLLYPPDPLPPEVDQLTPAGLIVNKYPVGLALLESPGLLLGHGIAIALRVWPADGASAPYQLSITLSLSLFYLYSVYLLYLAVIRFGAPAPNAGLLCMGMLMATNLWHYVVKEPAMAHGAGLALCCVVVFLLSRWPSSWEEIGNWSLCLVGACAGALFLLRNTNVFLAPVLASLIFRGRRFAVRPVFLMTASALAVSGLQPLALSILWGQLRLLPYPAESFTGGWNGVLGGLLSDRHGLIVYHPWYAVLLALCLLALTRSDLRVIAAGSIASVALLVVMNGSWWCWWFGDSFGNRAFIEALPPLTLVGALRLPRLETRSTSARGLMVLLVGAALLNALLWVGYVLKRFPPNGLHTKTEAYLWCLH